MILVISIIKERLLKKPGKILNLGKIWKTAGVKCYGPTCSWLDYPARKSKLGVEDETHDNIDDKVNEDDLYELDKIILDEKKWRNCTFESELKNTYAMKRPNGMNFINDNKVNKIAE